jgi:hypothetical protein
MSVVNVDPNDKYPRVYWPEELKRFGYTGEIEVICDPITGTIIHPNATPEQIIKSLENRIKDIQLRKAAGHTEFRPLEEKTTEVPSAKAPEVEWENIQCPYPDCGAPLMWHISWEQAVCSRCGRSIVRQKVQS